MLGGYHNFEVDRRIADQVLALYPDARAGCYACRAFLRRVVRYLSAQGIDQFLDIGAGIPTVGNTHEVAQQANPEARVVYVDIDPVAVAHSQSILKGDPRTLAIRADVRDTAALLAHPQVSGLLDFNRPVGVLLLLILHTVVDDEQAYEAVRTLREALAPGSYLAISHGTRENLSAEILDQLQKIGDATPTGIRYRSLAQLQPFLEGLELVEPGLVYIPLWRPEGPDDIFLKEPQRTTNYGAVGRKVS
jgi:SAM-dependent methyltransferase